MIIGDEIYLAYVRGLRCVFCGKEGPSDPDHLRNRKWREATRNDFTCVPACRECHSLRHSVGTLKLLEIKRMSVADVVEAVAMQLVAYFAKQQQRHIEAI